MRLLWVTAVEREAEALRGAPGEIVVAGVGRTNAAAATTEAILRRGPFDAVVSAGVAGALPRSPLDAPASEASGAPSGPHAGAFPQPHLRLGDLVLAESCVYFEEGAIMPDGFHTMSELGFDLGPFRGNRVPVDRTLDRLAPAAKRGVIATVATCSGTDEAAAEVVRRTGAVAEAMEGAAVVHAALRLGVPATEIRAISNGTGDRARQEWNLPAAFDALASLAAALRA